MSDPMEEIRQTFFVECAELLEAMEASLLAMQDGDDDPETVNAVFRAAHSIKGGAAAFAYTDLVRFAHRFESTLDEVRSQRLKASREVMETMLRASDMLCDLVRVAQFGGDIDTGIYETLISEFEALSEQGEPAPEPELAEEDWEPVTMSFDLDLPGMDGPEDLGAPSYTVIFCPGPNMLRNGSEPALILRELESLGQASTELEVDDVPFLENLDPLAVDFAWRVTIEGSDEESIRTAFEFVDADCELEIVKNELTEAEAPVEELQSTEEYQVEDVTEVADAHEETEVSTPEAVSSEPAEAVDSAAKPEAESPKQAPASKVGATVRVDLEKVDRLINLVGELVVNQAMLSQSVIDAGLAAGSAVAGGLDEFKQLTREVQDSVMAIRAQPVKSLFQRMSRIVREAAAVTGKSARLKLEGEMTEIDKTVVEQLAEPLTHMIRNAVDHGLESPEKRLEAGKAADGVIHLSAAHRSGRVIIEISDDGAGINRERVRQIAIEKGLISPDVNMTPTEIDNLLFMPGFSTAKEVSDLSGRGVGMDVVKRSIQSLGGKISIRSTPGEGSTFMISLPLTLAVLDGMVVDVAGETMIIPITSIIETIKPVKSQIHPLGREGQVVLVRGDFVPVVDVGAKLGMRKPLTDLANHVLILVDIEGVGHRAFAVDEIHDQRQVVMKSLEQNYHAVDGIAAATILGDGRVALILDSDVLGVSVPTPGDLEKATINSPEQGHELRRAG
jgi:two-component system chemotaxis sensor kinase CheA